MWREDSLAVSTIPLVVANLEFMTQCVIKSVKRAAAEKEDFAKFFKRPTKNVTAIVESFT
ncbi:hypothetical protein ACS0TY_034856 [Phlomoides rotata]